MLCGGQRPEGFGPQSFLASPLPTTCFTDSILIPLPTWLALLLLPILFVLSLRRRRVNPSTEFLRTKPPRNCLYTTTATIYYLLIVCNILMTTLEIARLELIHFGVGLLPFSYVGLIAGALLHWSRGASDSIHNWEVANGVLWVGGLVMSGVKVAGLVRMGISGRKGSKYPVSDQVIDIAVMAGVYAVMAMLELGLRFWRASRAGIWAGQFQEESESVVEQEQVPALAGFVAY